MKHKEQPSMLNYLSPLIMITLGLWHYSRHGVDLVAIILIVFGSFALYLALFNNLLLQHLLAFLTKLWYPVGQFITIMLLTVTFFVIFAPVGILLRLFKKDILNKNFESNRLSYWIDRSINGQSKYTQQF
jgi:hypothetical protein